MPDRVSVPSPAERVRSMGELRITPRTLKLLREAMNTPVQPGIVRRIVIGENKMIEGYIEQYDDEPFMFPS